MFQVSPQELINHCGMSAVNHLKLMLGNITEFPSLRYKLEAEIGEGSYGIVQRARDLET